MHLPRALMRTVYLAAIKVWCVKLNLRIMDSSLRRPISALKNRGVLGVSLALYSWRRGLKHQTWIGKNKENQTSAEAL